MGFNTMPLTPRLPVTMGPFTTTMSVSKKFVRQLMSLCSVNQHEDWCWCLIRVMVARHVQCKILMWTRRAFQGGSGQRVCCEWCGRTPTGRGSLGHRRHPSQPSWIQSSDVPEEGKRDESLCHMSRDNFGTP